jgi:hypothetical protein
MGPSKERRNVSFAKTKKYKEVDDNDNKQSTAENPEDSSSKSNTINKEAFFRFPDAVENDTDDDYELWTFRLPLGVEVEDLKNLVFDPNDPSSATFEASSSSSSTKYTLSIGHSVENESFRVLVPNQKDEDEDDNDDEEPTILVPSQLHFRKHFNVVQAVSIPMESELAPSSDVPLPDSVRRAYGHVPQKRDLKRRWKPIGCSDSIASSSAELTNSSVCHTSLPSKTKRLLSNEKNYSGDDDSQNNPVSKRAKINPSKDKSPFQNGSSHNMDNKEQNSLENKRKRHKKEKKAKKEKKKKKEKKSKERS